MTTTTKPEVLTYESCKAMPIGTVVADAAGYWQANRRHHVKTTPNTWALFFHYPSDEEIEIAVREKRNNLSPCPAGDLCHVFFPEVISGTHAAIASLTIRSSGDPS